MDSSRGYLVLDIETIPDTSIWSKPAGVESPFPPAYAHQVIVIGCMWLTDDYQLRRFGVIGGDDELALLEDLCVFVGQNRPVLVTYNGRSFDLPVIAMRALRHGVPIPWYYDDQSVRHRYSDKGHIDLCDWFADHGATRTASLDSLAKLIGLPGKLAVDGSQIEGMYQSGELPAIESYCLADVTQTALLFLRFRLLQGILTADEYRQAAGALTDSLRGDPRLAELLRCVDGGRLLSAA